MLYELIKNIIDPNLPLYSNLASTAAILYTMKDINWAGFYLIENDKLYISCYQGELACTSIEIGKGVCGTAVKERRSIIVDDVNQFKGHIACSSKSRSEIVVPIYKKDRIVGVIDIDAPIYNRFNEQIKIDLENTANLLGELFNE